MLSYSAKYKDLQSKVKNWFNYYRYQIIETSVTVGLIGSILGGCSYLTHEAEKVRSERIISSASITDRIKFDYIEQDKLGFNLHRWEIKDEIGNIIVSGYGPATLNTNHLTNKASSVTNELEREVEVQ